MEVEDGAFVIWVDYMGAPSLFLASCVPLESTTAPRCLWLILDWWCVWTPPSPSPHCTWRWCRDFLGTPTHWFPQNISSRTAARGGGPSSLTKSPTTRRWTRRRIAGMPIASSQGSGWAPFEQCLSSRCTITIDPKDPSPPSPTWANIYHI